MNELAEEEDELIKQMRQAREVPAVLKSKLAALRASLPDVCVLAFEGQEDKVVYFHWIKQLAPSFSYEAIVCKGKSKVLAFRDLLDRDLGGLKKNVYFFIDRDYDDRRGHADSDNLYMTEAYSVENYLVDAEVLEELLRVELHCNAEPTCRQNVLTIFDNLYQDFLDITRAINFRIFLSRRIPINRSARLPAKINRLAKISLTKIEPTSFQLEELVPLAREPLDAEVAALMPAFSELDPKKRYRGKFALLFFSTWLELLSSDRNAAKTSLFGGLDQDGVIAQGRIALDSIAAKTKPPVGLAEFIGRMTMPFTENVA